MGCRWDLFPVVSREKLRHIANSDFHRPEHLYAWKTLLRADKDPASILAALKMRSGSAIGMMRLQADEPAEASA